MTDLLYNAQRQRTKNADAQHKEMLRFYAKELGSAFSLSDSSPTLLAEVWKKWQKEKGKLNDNS